MDREKHILISWIAIKLPHSKVTSKRKEDCRIKLRWASLKMLSDLVGDWLCLQLHIRKLFRNIFRLE